jgi:glycosyltransferase involved in cell wall biosynthesis
LSPSLLLPWYRFPPFKADSIGGLSVAVWELTRNLKKAGVDVTVLIPPEGGDREISTEGQKVIESEIGERFRTNAVLEKDHLLMLDSFDAILSVNNFGWRGFASLFAKNSRVRKQVHTIAHDRRLETYVPLRADVRDYLRMIFLRRRERIGEKAFRGVPTACVSRYNLMRLLTLGLADETVASFIPNGIDTNSFRVLEREKTHDVLFVGRFQKSKALDVLVQALRLLDDQGLKLNLAVVGAFSESEQAIISKTTTSSIRQRMTFHGTIGREQMPMVMSESRLVAIPSRYESFGLPALEALACGVPVVGSNVGGLPELVKPDVGILVEPENALLLARAIRGTIQGSFGSSVRERGPDIAKNYDWRLISEQMKRFLFEQFS